jgi:hypothetical protein
VETILRVSRVVEDDIPSCVGSLSDSFITHFISNEKAKVEYVNSKLSCCRCIAI